MRRWLPTSTDPRVSRPACSRATSERRIRRTLSRVAHDTAAALLVAGARRSRPDGRRPPHHLHRRARHRRDRRALVARVGEEPPGRALARLPAAHADPAGPRRASASPSSAAPRCRTRSTRSSRARRSRRVPTRCRSSPTASSTGSSRATSPSRSSVPPRSRGWSAAGFTSLADDADAADAANPDRPASSPPAPCASRSSPTSSRRAPGSGGATRSTEIADLGSRGNERPRRPRLHLMCRAAVTPGSNIRRSERPRAERRSAAGTFMLHGRPLASARRRLLGAARPVASA